MELYEEVENKKKSKLTMIIGICIAVLILITVLIICGIIYLNGAVMRITVDGQSQNSIEKILYIPENSTEELYIPIRAIAKYLNYEDYRGDYKVKSEDATKCYVKNENEIAMFTKDSDTLIKTRGDSDYEYVKIDEKVMEKDGELYTTPEGIEKAFNILFEYNLEKKRINIYTMDYLNQYYSAKQKIDGESIKLSEEYSDKKAIFENMMIVIANNQYGVINAENGKSILENKYEEIKYLPATSDFLVKSNGKYGVIGKDGINKVRITYDEIKIMDNQNGLYMIKQNNLYGIVDTSGKVILSPEYKQIGIDINKYSSSGLENQYVLLDEVIPVKNNQDLWGFYNIKGELIKECGFTNIGCSSTSGVTESNAYPAVVIPSYKVIIVEKDKHFNLMTTKGEELIPTYILENVYMKINTETGENSFYMTFNNRVMSVEEWLASVGR